jgi:uncharacterized protein (DUF2141 family)
MKTIKKQLPILIFSIFALSVFSQGSNLSVKVTNLKNTKGNLLFGIYNNGFKFPDKKYAYRGSIQKVNSTSQIYTFKNLKPGNYAVAVIHDENKDQELSKNFIGIPKEGFGFSNNEIGMFGPPSFEKAAVSVKKDTTVIIKLRFM